VAPDVAKAKYFKKVFSQVQKEITKGTIAAGHDIGAGGLITSLLEMCFAADGLGYDRYATEKTKKALHKPYFPSKLGFWCKQHPKLQHDWKKRELVLSK
jgi:phosphoribosylformylglycinamidine synthase